MIEHFIAFDMYRHNVILHDALAVTVMSCECHIMMTLSSVGCSLIHKKAMLTDFWLLILNYV